MCNDKLYGCGAEEICLHNIRYTNSEVSCLNAVLFVLLTSLNLRGSEDTLVLSNFPDKLVKVGTC